MLLAGAPISVLLKWIYNIYFMNATLADITLSGVNSDNSTITTISKIKARLNPAEHIFVEFRKPAGPFLGFRLTIENPVDAYPQISDAYASLIETDSVVEDGYFTVPAYEADPVEGYAWCMVVR
jgi:hypothetical protein